MRCERNIKNNTLFNGIITGPSPEKSPRALRKVNFGRSKKEQAVMEGTELDKTMGKAWENHGTTMDRSKVG